jgi:hypothetical protein
MRKKHTPDFAGLRGGQDASQPCSSGPGLCVTVISTTHEGTASALSAARWLGKDLKARITLLSIEIVRDDSSLDQPPLAMDFPARHTNSLASRSIAQEEDVTARVCLCRNREGDLQRILRRRALVVIGGRRHWWLSGEERLEKALLRLGHHVIFVDCRRKTDRTWLGTFPPFLDSGTDGFRERAGSEEWKSWNLKSSGISKQHENGSENLEEHP